MTTPPPPSADPVDPSPSLQGVEVVRAFLRTLPEAPGVYRMINGRGDALYVGKAKSLKRRVVAYTRLEALPLRLQRMVSETVTMEVITTHTEAEALLLEANLIKKLKPRYNILLRDDKSFPYLVVRTDHPWPQVIKHRGARSVVGDYFGPFASAGAVNQTLGLLQRAFLLRTCSDAVFASRSRPCLLYQIKRCAGPCVERISQGDYQALVDQARAFLTGKSSDIQTALAARMEAHAEALEFEAAAVLRDRLRALSQIQGQKDTGLGTPEDADVIALHQGGGKTCIQVFFFRLGQNYGNRAYFPSHPPDADSGEILEAFLGQFYANKRPPKTVLLSQPLPNHDLIASALTLRAEHKVTLAVPQRGQRAKAMAHALTNAREALGRRLAETDAQATLLEGVAEVFGLDAPPQRVEVYDNSHIQGSHAVGAFIVAGPEGFNKSAYRTFSIRREGLTPGDDYAMMREVLERRFTRARKEDPDRDRGLWPDLVLIDGGAGQLSATLETLAEVGVEDVAVVAIAKGPDRNAGRERFFMPGREPFSLPEGHPVLYFLQRLRDEAHRFAIGTHRGKRSRAIAGSPLDELSGIGPKRKKALLHHFGSARAVADAGISELQAIEGISASLAKKIYDHFHPGR